MMRPRHAAFAIVLVIVALLALQHSPLSHSGSGAVTPSSSSVSIRLAGNISGWNATGPIVNPTITVTQGDMVSIILTSDDIDHQFALDLDHDGTKFIGMCPTGDTCSNVLRTGIGDTISFTANFAPGTYAYFCTFHINMVGSFVIRPASNPPTVAITSVSPNPASTGTPVTLDFSVTDPTTVSSLSIDWGDGTLTHPSPAATSDSHSYLTTSSRSQTFTINLTATNSLGHGSTTTTETITDRAPIVTISSILPNPAPASQPVTVTFSATDPDGTIASYTVNWGDSSADENLPATATSGSHTYSSAGSFTITLTATDNSGSTGQNSGSVNIQGPPKPTVTISSVMPNPANTGDSVTVDFGVSSTTAVTGITVNWGDDTATDTLAGSATSDTHIYANIGNLAYSSFTINVTATNGAGHASATISDTVNDRPPTLTITNLMPSPGSTGQMVTLNFTDTDPDGMVSLVTVNWGDGSTPDRLSASATSDTHSYNSTGTFTITITATDNGGSSTHVSSQPVTITAPPSPGHHHHHDHHHEHDSGREEHEEADTAQAHDDPEDSAE